MSYVTLSIDQSIGLLILEVNYRLVKLVFVNLYFLKDILKPCHKIFRLIE